MTDTPDGVQVQQALANKAWGMRLGTSEAALAELRGLTGMRDEGFSSKYLGLVGELLSCSSSHSASHSTEPLVC
jgi:hypothetical protein